MKITKRQLARIIKEETSGLQLRRAQDKAALALAEDIARMIRDHDQEHWEGGMDRGTLLFILEQAEKKFNELLAQGGEELSYFEQIAAELGLSDEEVWEYVDSVAMELTHDPSRGEKPTEADSIKAAYDKMRDAMATEGLREMIRQELEEAPNYPTRGPPPKWKSEHAKNVERSQRRAAERAEEERKRREASAAKE